MHRGFSHQHRALRGEALHDRRVAVRHEIAEQLRTTGGANSLRLEDILDGDREAVDDSIVTSMPPFTSFAEARKRTDARRPRISFDFPPGRSW